MDKVIRDEVLKQIVSGESSCRFISTTHWYGSTHSIYLMKDSGATDWEKDTGGCVFFIQWAKHRQLEWRLQNMDVSKTLINGQSYLVLSYQKKQFMNKLKMKSQCTPHIWIPNLVLHAHTHHSTRCGCGATVVNRKCLQCQAYHNVVIKKNFFCSSPNTNTKTYKNMNICDVFEFVVLWNCKIYEYIRNPIPPKQSIV